MKSVLFALVAVASITASAGQDTAGCKFSANKKYVTCQVAGSGEAGSIVSVTFKVRKGSAAPEADLGCAVGDGGYTACNKDAKVPQILKDINQAFIDAGFTTPETPDLHIN